MVKLICGWYRKHTHTHRRWVTDCELSWGQLLTQGSDASETQIPMSCYWSCHYNSYLLKAEKLPSKLRNGGGGHNWAVSELGLCVKDEIRFGIRVADEVFSASSMFSGGQWRQQKSSLLITLIMCFIYKCLSFQQQQQQLHYQTRLWADCGCCALGARVCLYVCACVCVRAGRGLWEPFLFGWISSLRREAEFATLAVIRAAVTSLLHVKMGRGPWKMYDCFTI